MSGGASGIGRASTLALTASGAKVAIADVDEVTASELLEIVRERGGQAAFHRVDILNDDSVRDSIDSCVRQFGRLDIVVNSAGKTSTDSYDDFERNVDMFLFGTFRAMRTSLPLLQQFGGGVIINIASIAGVTGSIGPAGYGPSKSPIRKLLSNTSML